MIISDSFIQITDNIILFCTEKSNSSEISNKYPLMRRYHSVKDSSHGFGLELYLQQSFKDISVEARRASHPRAEDKYFLWHFHRLARHLSLALCLLLFILSSNCTVVEEFPSVSNRSFLLVLSESKWQTEAPSELKQVRKLNTDYRLFFIYCSQCVWTLSFIVRGQRSESVKLYKSTFTKKHKLPANNANVCSVPSSVGVLTNTREVSMSHQCPLWHHRGPSIFYKQCLRNGAFLRPELRFIWSAGASPGCHRVMKVWHPGQVVSLSHGHGQINKDKQPLTNSSTENFLFTSNACFWTGGGSLRTQRELRENPCRNRKNL